MKSILNKLCVLELNKAWFPISIKTPKKVFENFCTGNLLALDITYSDEDIVNENFNNPVEMRPVGWDEWVKLPVRDYDLFISTVKTEIRVPNIVICSAYDRIPDKTPRLSKKNIMLRDGYVCFVPESKVLTNIGLKEIQDIENGDLVLNQNGLSLVDMIFGKQYNGVIFNIKSIANFNIKSTKDHKILCLPNPNKTINEDFLNNLTLNDFVYKSAFLLEKGDLLINNINYDELFKGSKEFLDLSLYLDNRKNYDIKETSISNYHNKEFDRFLKIDNELSFLVGLYAAEGSYHKNCIQFSLHSNEKELQSKIINYFNKLSINTNIFFNGNRCDVLVYSALIRDLFISLVPGKCCNKKISNVVFELFDKSFYKDIIKGYCEGDGYLLHKSIFRINRTTVSSISEDLIKDIKLMSNVIGLFPCPNIVDRVNKNRVYELSFMGECNKNLWNHTLKFRKSNKIFKVKIDNYQFLLSRITKINKEVYSGIVYDLSIDDELHQYNVEGILVHNCQYSNVQYDKHELNIDHVVPLSRNGKNDWTNLVTCHHSINTRKGNKTLKEAGLTLLRTPRKPTISSLFFADKTRDPRWGIFLKHLT